MTGLSPDHFYDKHLVHGFRWEQPIAPKYRKMMHAMGIRTRGYIVRGPDAPLDEVIVLELGRHVEMEFSMQALAADGIHWDNLGQYLDHLMDRAVQS